jgi:hypothetical protein
MHTILDKSAFGQKDQSQDEGNFEKKVCDTFFDLLLVVQCLRSTPQMCLIVVAINKKYRLALQALLAWSADSVINTALQNVVRHYRHCLHGLQTVLWTLHCKILFYTAGTTCMVCRLYNGHCSVKYCSTLQALLAYRADSAMDTVLKKIVLLCRYCLHSLPTVLWTLHCKMLFCTTGTACMVCKQCYGHCTVKCCSTL